MDRNHPSRRDRRSHPFPLGIEDLEGRQLPSSFFGAWGSSNYYNQVAYQASIVQHEFDAYVGELKQIEVSSQATPAEYLALRNDTRAISAVVSAANLPRANAQYNVVQATILIDRAPLDGWMDDAGWAQISGRLSDALAGMNVPQSLLDQTVTDMRTLATSAGVGAFDFATFTDDFNTLRSGEQALPANSGYHFKDPGLYYTQHLRGFFRGWGIQKIEARATLDRDLRDIKSTAATSPAGASVIGRDVQILQSLGAAIPSTVNAQFGAAYVAAFDQGVPGPTMLAQLQTNLVTILGPAATASRVASVDRLVHDAPAFYAAVGSSEAAIETIVTDVGTLVNAGGGEPLNPFKVTIQPGRAASAGG